MKISTALVMVQGGLFGGVLSYTPLATDHIGISICMMLLNAVLVTSYSIVGKAESNEV